MSAPASISVLPATLPATTSMATTVVESAVSTLSMILEKQSLTPVSLLAILAQLIQTVESFSLPGVDKKAIVMKVLNDKAQSISDPPTRDSLILLINTVGATAIDTLVAAASGQLAVNIRKMCCC
jgi:hypothetical protein